MFPRNSIAAIAHCEATLLRFNKRLVYGQVTMNEEEDARWLVMNSLGKPYDEHHASFPVSESEWKVIQDRLLRRIQGEPVAYIVGEAPLGHLTFTVDPRVLIPRSYISELLPLPSLSPTRILDMCCGSGCLGILAASHYPQASVVACDISKDALDVASINVTRHNMTNRVTLRQSDMWSAFTLEDKSSFDLVLCNPPYVDEKEMRLLPAEYRKEPSIALRGNNLQLVKEFMKHVHQYTKPQATVIVEVGWGKVQRIRRAFAHLELEWPKLSSGKGAVYMFKT